MLKDFAWEIATFESKCHFINFGLIFLGILYLLKVGVSVGVTKAFKKGKGGLKYTIWCNKMIIIWSEVLNNLSFLLFSENLNTVKCQIVKLEKIPCLTFGVNYMVTYIQRMKLQSPKFKRVSQNETPDFPFWGLNICVDFVQRDLKKWGIRRN